MVKWIGKDTKKLKNQRESIDKLYKPVSNFLEDCQEKFPEDLHHSPIFGMKNMWYHRNGRFGWSAFMNFMDEDMNDTILIETEKHNPAVWKMINDKCKLDNYTHENIRDNASSVTNRKHIIRNQSKKGCQPLGIVHTNPRLGDTEKQVKDGMKELFSNIQKSFEFILEEMLSEELMLSKTGKVREEVLILLPSLESFYDERKWIEEHMYAYVEMFMKNYIALIESLSTGEYKFTKFYTVLQITDDEAGQEFRRYATSNKLDQPMSFFEELFGFEEDARTKEKFTLHGLSLIDRVTGENFNIGSFKTPSLNELREEAKKISEKIRDENITLEHIVTDDIFEYFHKNDGALFQVASQFNCLEMVSEDITPEEGITDYEQDNTQGPACSIACASATLYRNYFCKVSDHQQGQTSQDQINNLEDFEKIIGNGNGNYFCLSNGYVRLNIKDGECSSTPKEIRKEIAKEERNILNQIAYEINTNPKCGDSIRVGVHKDVSVNFKTRRNGKYEKEQRNLKVTQVFCSALPIAYHSAPSAYWEPFAKCVLNSAYQSTLAAAVINKREKKRQTVFLTLIGGGVFGNENEWIANAIKLAVQEYKSFPLDIKICHKTPNGKKDWENRVKAIE